VVADVHAIARHVERGEALPAGALTRSLHHIGKQWGRDRKSNCLCRSLTAMTAVTLVRPLRRHFLLCRGAPFADVCRLLIPGAVRGYLREVKCGSRMVDSAA